MDWKYEAVPNKDKVRPSDEGVKKRLVWKISQSYHTQSESH